MLPRSVLKMQECEETLRECAFIGAAVLDAQKVEFALYGAISHLAGLPQNQDSRFRNLDPEKFLRGDVKDLKATLGQLVRAFGDKLLLTTEDLNKFVAERNLIVHDYWRLTKAHIQGGQRLEDPQKFLMQFTAKCLHWKKVLQGFIALMKIEAAKHPDEKRGANLTTEEEDCIEYYKQNAKNHLVQRGVVPSL